MIHTISVVIVIVIKFGEIIGRISCANLPGPSTGLQGGRRPPTRRGPRSFPGAPAPPAL